MLNLIMVIHCHQPVGNFDHVFERAHAQCYKPLLDLLMRHPSIKLGLHFSGPLYEWFEQHEPKTIDRMASLVERGQVEVLSGGFYEPLLPSIPERDARGQVRMMNDYLMRRFSHEPSGFWLTERIWDPGLPLTLSGTGMRYTVVDDTHFYYAGLNPQKIYGRYITEKEGQTLSLLATPMIMRYLIPFKPVEEVLHHLHGLKDAGHEVVVYGDDGEKFGLWPGTHEWVIQKGWLEKFFRAVTDNADWLSTTLPGDYVASSNPLGRIYLPQASYEEMTEWALPAEQSQTLEDIIASLKEDGRWETWRPFVRGGVWDNFLVKYDEANRMHKKMILLSEHLKGNSKGREDLWRGQCNCAYWHGIFGGLYLGHLRRAVHENLIRAQACLLAEQDENIQFLQCDIDKDGADEILICTSHLSLGIDPGKGGGLFEIAHLPHALNLSDTLTRRYEAYHRRLKERRADESKKDQAILSIHDMAQFKEKNLEQSLIVDPYTRLSLLDHFLPLQTTLDDYERNIGEELGDFIRGVYQVEETSFSSANARVTLARHGTVGPAEVSIMKEIRVGREGLITIDYQIECLGTKPLSVLFGCEFNLTIFSDQDQERYYFAPDYNRRREVSEIGVEKHITRFDLINRPDHLTASFHFPLPVTVWFFPLMTVSQSEEGFERTYQGSSFLFHYPLELHAGETSRFRIELALEEI